MDIKKRNNKNSYKGVAQARYEILRNVIAYSKKAADMPRGLKQRAEYFVNWLTTTATDDEITLQRTIDDNFTDFICGACGNTETTSKPLQERIQKTIKTDFQLRLDIVLLLNRHYGDMDRRELITDAETFVAFVYGKDPNVTWQVQKDTTDSYSELRDA